jgi:SAM-dependent methyltransferase
MSSEPNVSGQMRADWNQRALEDANYYVAFGRRDQSDDEFYETAREVLAGLNLEMKRLGPGNQRARRALEIGCGPGRLIKSMSSRFGEIHGVDVSDEMIRIGREKLRGIPHAHLHATDGSSLGMFADDSFDMVYSYAVFQHIPSKEVVLEYLRETHRVLKPGGIFRGQLNGLPESFPKYDTWSGVRFRASEIIGFTREYDLQLLALDGADTQYMWTTWRKRAPGWRKRLQASSPERKVQLRRITNSNSSEPISPSSGRYASISIWVTGLPDEADLFDMDVRIGGIPGRQTYIGPPDTSGVQQVNAMLGEGVRTGMVPVELRWFGRPMTSGTTLRVIPAGPQVPRILMLSDGINLLAGTRIETRSVKVAMEEVSHPDRFGAQVGESEVEDIEIFCTDPQTQRYEVNFRIPESIPPGPHLLRMRLGRRQFAPVPIEVVR